MRALRLLIYLNLSKHTQPAKFKIKGIQQIYLNIVVPIKSLYTVG